MDALVDKVKDIVLRVGPGPKGFLDGRAWESVKDTVCVRDRSRSRGGGSQGERERERES